MSPSGAMEGLKDLAMKHGIVDFVVVVSMLLLVIFFADHGRFVWLVSGTRNFVVEHKQGLIMIALALIGGTLVSRSSRQMG